MESPIFIAPLAFCIIDLSTMVIKGDTRNDADTAAAVSTAYRVVMPVCRGGAHGL